MSKKFNGNITLFELKEHCKKIGPCSKCEFSEDDTNKHWMCMLRNTDPAKYELYTPKTYKEDFLEKFPNAKLRTNFASGVCLINIYGAQHAPLSDPVYPCRGFTCEECWNRVMPEEE